MAKYDISQLDDTAKAQLIEARWSSSAELWEIVSATYKANTAEYENRANWLDKLPARRRDYRVQANRVFPNMESVINSLIANPPALNVLPGQDGEASKELSRKLESFYGKKFLDRNTKEIVRKGLRNLYFGRLIVIKAFWNPQIDDFDFKAIDPRKIRVGKYASKEQDTEFAIEEIDDNLCAVVERFPAKKEELMKKYGIQSDIDLYVKNPDVTYKEAWINDSVIFKLENIILDTIKNPYWDWDGILVTPEEEESLNAATPEQRRMQLQSIKLEQDTRNPVQQEMPEEKGMLGKIGDAILSPFTGGQDASVPQAQSQDYRPYYFNYFDKPRKPYIFATIFNNENSPIGRTDMITLSSELQRGVNKRKMDIDENCEFMNGVLKVDSTVMDKADAQRIRFETKGLIWGKGVTTGVVRETGVALPALVYEDMLDSRQEIDNIMAASSAFRGERQGQETKAGRLALIQQSYLRLNELVQVVDYVYHEMFSWAFQLGKTRYTEPHYAKWMGKEGGREMIDLLQDDFETGSEITIVSGKTLPVDDEFKFEQAQNDVKNGYISPVDYLKIAKYDDSKQLAKNAVAYKINPVVASGVTPEEMQNLQPDAPPEEKPPSISISYADLPPDAQVQLLAKIGIQADPNILIAEKIADRENGKQELEIKKQSGKNPEVEAEIEE